jgi:hypothetical protein
VSLTFDEIMACDDLPQETFFVPEWDGEVVVRGLSRGEALAARKEAWKSGEFDLLVYDMYVLMYGLVEPKISKGHFDRMKGKSAGAIEKVSSKIISLSSVPVTQEAIDEAEASFREGGE